MTSASSRGPLGITEYSTPSDDEVQIVRVFDAPRALVFDAWTNPEHIPHWCTGPEGWTMPVCEAPQKAGDVWRYVYRKDGGGEMTISGRCMEFTPPARLVTTESWGPDWPETTNTAEFLEQGSATIVKLTIRYASKAVRDAALASGMKTGLDASFARLESILHGIA